MANENDMNEPSRQATDLVTVSEKVEGISEEGSEEPC